MMSSKLPEVIKIEWVKRQIVIFVEGNQQFSFLIRSKDEYGLWPFKINPISLDNLCLQSIITRGYELDFEFPKIIKIK